MGCFNRTSSSILLGRSGLSWTIHTDCLNKGSPAAYDIFSRYALAPPKIMHFQSQDTNQGLNWVLTSAYCSDSFYSFLNLLNSNLKVCKFCSRRKRWQVSLAMHHCYLNTLDIQPTEMHNLNPQPDQLSLIFTIQHILVIRKADFILEIGEQAC